MKRVNGFLVEFNNFENYEMDEIYITIAIKGGIVNMTLSYITWD